jgi:Rv2525c-like, glycoside hydrolase-like domain
MTRIIDTNVDITSRLAQLRARGIETVIRYVSSNTSNPKVVKPAEARAIAAAGLKLALVYQTWGGANNFAHDDIHADSGAHDGAFALSYAPTVGAPDRTIIWFAIDTDCSASEYERLVKPYLIAARAALRGKYRIGVYACGFVCDRALDEHLVDATWLTQSMGFNGSRAFRDSRRWTLFQGLEIDVGGLGVDPNDASGDDYGAFVPFEAPVAVPVAVGPSVPQAGAPAVPHIDLARIQQDLARLGQLAGWLTQVTAALSGRSQPAAGASTPAPQLSPIDKMLGGEALVGLKTPLAIGAMVLMWILQAAGAMGTATGDKATMTGSVLTWLISGFGAMGVTAKFDRAFQAISTIAAWLQKPPAPPPQIDDNPKLD